MEEALRAVISALDASEIDELMRALPEDFVNALSDFVASAPMTDAEWRDFRVLMLDGDEGAARDEFRRNTEALRAWFESNT